MQAGRDFKIFRTLLGGQCGSCGVAVLAGRGPQRRGANRSNYGLGGGVWTRDIGRALRVTRALNTGTVWVNT
ncbi:aldehyde dehydrogenase family protein [Streptomyces sp. NPDC001978]|uniref:aldehyde dehydrogenase family protein n=1 Tax=Streptomyces sp. NPDC001978 TaxID=3364627 RepID=UPI00367A544F